VLGPATGLVVFAVDVLKGALPVALLPGITSGTMPRAWVAILYGAAAVIGHVRPVWLGFSKGGKGVATACGVFLALAPLPTLVAIGVFVAALLSTGFVSLGSMAAAVALPVLVWAERGLHSPFFTVSVATAIFVVWTHQPNLHRLSRGEEHGFSKLGRLSARAGLLIGAIVAAAGVAWLLWRGGRG
jgi:glycerol-3-phosphate acyltransferase PlsY